jgi:hypothetical protein
MLFLILGAPGRAAEVECDLFAVDDGKPMPSGARPTADTCSVGYLYGRISKGDYQRVLDFYTKNHPFLVSFKLNSPGGDVEEALKIGRLLRKYLIAASAPHRLPDGRVFLESNGRRSDGKRALLCEGGGCVCASACAFIWLGATQRFGSVGLHRPRTEDPAFKALAPGDAANAYRRMLDNIIRYLDEMEAPRPIVDVMVATSSGDIRWVDHSTYGLGNAPSFREWLDASCGHLRKQAKQQRVLTFDDLVCEGQLVSSHRDRLPLP